MLRPSRFHHLQLMPDQGHRPRPVSGVFPEALIHQLNVGLREVWTERAQLRRAFPCDPPHHFVQLQPLKRQLPGGKLVEQHAEGEDIATLVDFPSRQKLGRHIVRGPTGGLAGINAARTAPLCQAEIDELQYARLGEEGIGRLNVSMDDPMAMCVAESRGQLQGVVEDFRDWQLPVRSAILEAAAAEVLQCKKGSAIGLTDVVEHADIGMVQCGDRLGLTPEQLTGVAGIQQSRRKELQGHQSFQSAIAGFVDSAHPALADQAQKLVLGRTFPQITGCGHGPALTQWSLGHTHPEYNGNLKPVFQEGSEPLRIGHGSFGDHVAGIERAGRLEKQDFDFLLRHGTMFHAAGHDEKLALLELNGAG
jgi:hypothetical protein